MSSSSSSAAPGSVAVGIEPLSWPPGTDTSRAADPTLGATAVV